MSETPNWKSPTGILADENEKLRAHIEDLEAQGKPDAEDARRYRWLRDKGFRHAIEAAYGFDSVSGDYVRFVLEFHIPGTPAQAGLRFVDNTWQMTDFDTAIDRAVEGWEQEEEKHD